ncbi:MAG TPA: carboxypeptidase regulatory-like domain-containing protein, partial [Geobacteraceae bacterium]
MKRLIIAAVAWLTLSTAAFSYADTSTPAANVLTSFDFNIVGVGLKASPDYQAVPKGIASKVDTVFDAGSFNVADIISQLPQDYTVRAELSGPAFQTPLPLVTKPGKAFDLPTLAIYGKYTLANIRLVDGAGNVLFGAMPQAVAIESIPDPLITSVTTRPLTLTELQQRGVTFDTSNFTAYEFTAGIATQSGQVPLTLPVLIPNTSTLVNPQDIPSPQVGGITPPPVSSVPPELENDVPQNLAVAPFMMEVQDQDLAPNIKLPPIPGIVVIPGNIGFLHQYFSALALVTNGAPLQSGLVIKDVQAKIVFPTGEDLVPGTDAAPGDDPLRMAKGADGFFPRIMAVMNPGPDGKNGTADDVGSLNPSESGQADFTIEGLKEGTHQLTFEITATLEGLPIGPVTLKGKATGAVLVRNPDFAITLGHPATVRSGEAYDLFVTITNTGKSIANLLSVHLDPRALSGATFAAGETGDKDIETILPGSSAVVKFHLVSQRTGKVTATAFESEDVTGRFILRVGVGENGIPLSPDSLILPYTGSLSDDLVNSAVGLLGQAWSVATAPTGALPADVLPISKQTVSNRAYDLSEAGLRILIGDTTVKAVEDLAFDYLGSDNANIGFDHLRRTSTQGENFNRAMAAIFQEEAAAAGLLQFQAGFADKVSYRPGHISVATGDAPVRVRVSDSSGNRTGGLSADEEGRGIPYADQLLLAESDASRSTLTLITKLDSANYNLELAADADATFDMGIVVPGAGGTLQQVTFSGVTLSAGAKASLLLTPGSGNSYALAIDRDGDGVIDGTVAASAVSAIADHAPQVVAATQIVPGFGPGGDKHGRNVAILFDQRVSKESAQNIANYAVDANAVNIATLQPSSRMAFLLLRDGIGPFFPRSLTVSGLADSKGNAMAAPATLPIRTTAQGPAAVVTGTVRTARGEPIPGATVRLLQLIWYDNPITFELEQRYAIFSEKSVNADGSYQFDYVLQNDDPAGPFMIEAINPQTGETGDLTASVLHHGQRLTLDMFMKAHGSVSGTVRDASGNPVANCAVQISTLADGRSYVKTTDASGAFSFSGIVVGAFSLKAVSQATASEGATMGTLPEDGTSVTQDVTIYRVADFKRGNISGKILSADGITPRAGAIVIVNAPNYQNWLRSAADGSFIFTGVYAGSVTLTVRDDTSGEYTQVTGAVSDGATSVFNIILKGTGTVQGRVERGDGNSAQGLYVIASVNLIKRVVQTDATGVFIFNDLPTGQIGVEVLDPRDFNRTVASGTVSLLSAGDTANIYLYVPNTALATAAIQGTVYHRDGTAWASAPIRRLVNDYQYYSYMAGADGHYSIPDLPLGTYRLVVQGGKEVVNATATLWYGTQTATVDLHPAGIGTVTGTTYDDAAKTMPTGADVTLVSMKPDQIGWLRYNGSLPTVVKSDPQTGKYTFTGVYAGNFTVSSSNIFRPTPVSAGGSITSDNQTVTVDLALKGSVSGGTPVNQMGSISGQVLMPDGTAAGEGVRVTVTFGGADVTVTTDSGGKFQFTPIIPSGNQRLTAEDPVTTLKWLGYVSVPAGLDVPMTIKLLGRGSMTVRVFNADATPAAGAGVTVNGTAYPNDTAAGTTGSDGTITFDNLSQGSYAVSARDNIGRGGASQGSIPADKAAVIVDVKLAPSGIVTGRFLKADGATPIPGGQVKLLQGGQVVAYATTSSEPATLGQYRMEYVPLGDFTLDGFDPVTERRGIGGGRLVNNGDTVTADIIVTPRGTVKGSVLNYSGTAPVAGASVSISVSGVTGYSYSSTTGPDGSFLFAGVPAGKFAVSATDPTNGLTGQASGTLSYEGETAQTQVNI